MASFILVGFGFSVCIRRSLSPFLALFFLSGAVQGVEFNAELLDIKDRENIDLGQFASADFIMPGVYTMDLKVNQTVIDDQEVAFYPPDNDPNGSQVCLSPNVVERLELKKSVEVDLSWWHQGKCLDLASLRGVEARGELSTSTLHLSVPQSYLEYSDPNWDPPSRWDEGVAGLMFDYNLNSLATRHADVGGQSYDLSGNGVLGANLGRWRFRADWQAQGSREADGSSQQSLGWSRYYAYTAVPELLAKLSVGEMYLDSRIFDGFRYSGLSLSTDDTMQSPNLRGYAPEVVGVARTNAKVIVSQLGRVLYESQVPAGPFHIRNINESVVGKLNVKIEELDGTVQEFDMDTANIPYLTRPGSVRYNMSVGEAEGSGNEKFFSGDFSWGINNGWSLYGGSILNTGYNSASLGFGRDLLKFGAISLDVSQSKAKVTGFDTLSGRSYRLSYSKAFEEYDSQVTFAGYRFSEENFLTMNDYLSIQNQDRSFCCEGTAPGDLLGMAHTYDPKNTSSKAMYTVMLNKQFRDSGLGVYFNYSKNTFWSGPSTDRYSLSASKYLQLGRVKNISLSLSAYNSTSAYAEDRGAYLSISVPWGDTGYLSYNASVNNNIQSHRVNTYDRIGNRDSYQLSAGTSTLGESFSGFYSHSGDYSDLSVNGTHEPGQYSAVGVSAQGGSTLSMKGGAFHSINGGGGSTRLLIDTNGVGDVPVSSGGGMTRTNRYGKAVIGNVNQYYRNTANIDLNELPENVEVVRSVAQAVLTEGAIGYRKFEVLYGEKAMSLIRLEGGASPPFGAIVLNQQRQEAGIVGDDGSVYLTGLRPGQNMTLHWDGEKQCDVKLPEVLTDLNESILTLLCTRMGS